MWGFGTVIEIAQLSESTRSRSTTRTAILIRHYQKYELPERIWLQSIGYSYFKVSRVFTILFVFSVLPRIISAGTCVPLTVHQTVVVKRDSWKRFCTYHDLRGEKQRFFNRTLKANAWSNVISNLFFSASFPKWIMQHFELEDVFLNENLDWITCCYRYDNMTSQL